MVQFVNANPPGMYEAVAASQTDQVMGPVGATGDFLDYVIVIPTTVAPGAVTIKDGSTAIITTTAGTATVLPGVFTIPVKCYSTTGAWKISTGTNVAVLAVGKFS